MREDRVIARTVGCHVMANDHGIYKAAGYELESVEIWDGVSVLDAFPQNRADLGKGFVLSLVDESEKGFSNVWFPFDSPTAVRSTYTKWAV